MSAAPRHPDFEPGNTVALKHGARSDRTVAVRADVVRSQVADVAPWLTEAIYADALDRYCRAEARARLLSDYIFETAATKGAGRVAQRLWEAANSSDRGASKLAEQLGLTPQSHQQLRATAGTAELTERAVDRLTAEGRQVRIDAEARLRMAELDEGDDDANRS